MRRISFKLVLLIAVVSASPLWAGVIPVRWEKVDAQKPGTRLTVILKSGERIVDVAFKGSDSTSLTVDAGGAVQQRLTKTEVTRVETSFVVPDSVKDGVVAGVAIGVLPGIWAALFADVGGKFRWPGAILANAALWGLISYVIDKNAQGPEVLYQSK